MTLFKNKFGARVALAKTIGFGIGLFAFFVIPLIFPEADIMFRLGILFLYTFIGAVIGIFGVMNKHPMCKFSMPFWIRGTLIGSVLNAIIVLFAYDHFHTILSASPWSEYSPFVFVIEGAIIGLFIDYIATKYFGEGKKLLK